MNILYKLVEKFLKEDGSLNGQYASCGLKTLTRVRPYAYSQKVLKNLCTVAQDKGFKVKMTTPNQEHPSIKELVFTMEGTDWTKLRINYPQEFFTNFTSEKLTDEEFQMLYEG